jgi:hypothetical protein
MIPTAAHFGPESYEQGTSREWLVTNGLGGYASATAIGCNTRAYHGLLVAALPPQGTASFCSHLLTRRSLALVSPTTNIPAWSIPKDFGIYRSFGSIRFPDSVIRSEKPVSRRPFP